MFPITQSYGDVFSTSVTLLDDATLDEDVPDDMIGDTEFLGIGWSNSVDDKVKKAIAYVKFDISKLPSNDDPLHVVNLNSAELELFLQTIWAGEDHNWFLVTVSSCTDNQWSEDTITWNNRTCTEPSTITTQDSILVSTSDVPSFFSWNVINIIRHAQTNNLQEITFIISSYPLDVDNVIDLEEEEYRELDANVVWAWSSEKKNVGINAGPTLNITYTVTDSLFSNWIMITATIAAAVTGIMVLLKKFFPNSSKDNHQMNTKEESS